MGRARYGLLPLDAHRPHTDRRARCCSYCLARGSAHLETLQHVFSACPRYLNIYRKRHDAFGSLVLSALRTELQADDAACGQYEIRRELSLGGIAREHTVADEHKALRPDAYLIDRRLRTVTPIEFTIPDDARLAASVRAKHDKYAAALAAATPKEGLGRFRPLAVVAIGAWGAVPPSTQCALIRLGIAPAAVAPLLKKAIKIIARHANVIARRRFAAARRGMPAAV